MTTMGGEYLGSSRILGAMLFSGLLIVGAYTLARGVESPPMVQASTETELLKQIAAKDADNDGLPDWEEVLYGTNPAQADSKNLGMTDGKAVQAGLIVPRASVENLNIATSSPGLFDGKSDLPVPAEGTLTRALSERLISVYGELVAQNPDGTLSDADIQNLRNQLVAELNDTIIPVADYKKRSDLTITGSSSEDLLRFAISVETAFGAASNQPQKSEIDYLKQAQNGDVAAYAQMAAKAAVYQKAAAALAAIPVPEKLSSDDLNLINSFSRLSKIIQDFSRAESDPLAAMFALRQYPDAVKQMATSLANMVVVYRMNGIKIEDGEPGAGFVNIVDRVIEKRKARTTTRP